MNSQGSTISFALKKPGKKFPTENTKTKLLCSHHKLDMVIMYYMILLKKTLGLGTEKNRYSSISKTIKIDSEVK